MKKEADSGKSINVTQIQSCISDAACLSLSTLKHILKDYEHNKWVGKECGTPQKKRPRWNIKLIEMNLTSV
jgi:hypothetical protein